MRSTAWPPPAAARLRRALRPTHRLTLCAAVALTGLLCAAGCSRAVRMPVEDMTVAFAVRTALVNDARVGAAPIEVFARDGVVTLDGRVATAEERDRIVAIARGVAGVRRVDSRITLATPAADDPTEPDTTPRQSTLPPQDPWPPTRYFAVGGAVEQPRMRSDDLDGLWSIGPTFRFGRGSGPGLTFGYSRLRADLPPTPGTSAFGDLRLSLVTAGLAYGITTDRWTLTPSVSAGYSFNHVRLDPGFAVPADTSLPVAADGSVVFMPGLTLWREVSPRVSIGLSASYVLTRPQASWLEGDRFVRRRLTADAMVIGVRAAYWVF